MYSIRPYLRALLIAVFLTACGQTQNLPLDEPEDPSIAVDTEATNCPDKDESWTFMFYIVADDGGVDFDTSSARYLNTMPALPENVEALVLIDRCERPYWPIYSTTGQILDACAQLYRIQRDGKPELLDTSPYKLDWLDDSQGDVNMGSANTLAAFIQFGMEQIDTTNYGLIVSGHGNGDQVGFDSTNDSSLNHHGLGIALEKGLTKIDRECNRKLDLVVMAACGMATAGIYISLAPHTHWLIASQENIYGYDLAWMGGLASGSPLEPIHIEEVSDALEGARVDGATGMGQQVTFALTQEDADAMEALLGEVSAALNQEGISRTELEDSSFNPRTFDLRMVTEKLHSVSLLEKLDPLLTRIVLSKTELSDAMRDQLEANGISATTSDLGLPGSLLF